MPEATTTSAPSDATTDGKPDTTTTSTTEPVKPAETDGGDDLAKWKAIARDNEKRAKANADAAIKLAELEERDKTETQKLTERAEKAEQAAVLAERDALRARVALAKNLPPKLASRLQGDTEAEMKADADELLAEIGASKKGPNFDGGARKTADADDDDMNARLRRAAGRA